MRGLSAEKDHTELVEFFKVDRQLVQCYSLVIVSQNKDTSKYDQTLAQALDSIRAKITYIEVCCILYFWFLDHLQLSAALFRRYGGMVRIEVKLLAT